MSVRKKAPELSADWVAGHVTDEDRMTATRYFRRPEDARLYDGTVRMLVDHYDLVHATIARVVATTVVAPDDDATLNILDIGCGTGKEALCITALLPASTVTALDMSEEMLAVFEEKLSQPERWQQAARIQLVHADIEDLQWSSDRLCALIRGNAASRYDAIVSAFTFHHLKTETLSRLYTVFSGALRPGGVFVNGDLFDFRWRDVSSAALDIGVEYIRDQLDQVQNRRTIRRLGGRPADLRDLWMKHMVVDNEPLPVEDGQAGAKPGHRTLLAASGFTAIECPFRHWQTGVLCAQRR